jgi:hypothetical protein
MTYIKINDQQYHAVISGRHTDKDWDNRESKSITLEMSYEDAVALFVDDLDWEIVYKNGETTEVYDNSEFSLAGPITDNRNGTVTVKMGKPTADEILAAILGG